MSLHAAATITLAIVTLLNLLLILGVVRRLREQAPGGSHATDDPGPVMLSDGELVGSFGATATTGEVVDRERLSGLTLVGFFSPGCTACKEKLPDFVRRADTMVGGRERVIATITSREGAGEGMIAALEPVAQVVVEQQENPLFIAFDVRGFPAYCLVDADGRVQASARDLRELPLLVTT